MNFIKRFFDQGELTPAKFAPLAMQALVDAGLPSATIEYDAQKFAIKHGSNTMFLANVFATYERRADAGERAAVLAQWARSMVSSKDLPTSFEEARANILPTLRPIEETWFPAFVARETGYLDRPFADPELVVSLAYDFPESLARLQAHSLEAWNVSVDEAWDVAFHNLRLRSAGSWESLTPQVFVSQWDDAYDSSRILLPDVIYRTGVTGRPLVMAPTRDRVIVVGEREDDALETLVKLGHSFYDEDAYGRSPVPLVYDGDQLSVLELPPHLAVAVARRSAGRRATLYAQQAEVNQAAYGDVFFANLMVFVGDDSATLRTVATWGRDVDTLLPRSALVSFACGGDDVFMVRWDDVERVLGPFTQDTKLLPIRYRVTEFPNDGQLAQLRALAVKFASVVEPVLV